MEVLQPGGRRHGLPFPPVTHRWFADRAPVTASSNFAATTRAAAAPRSPSLCAETDAPSYSSTSCCDPCPGVVADAFDRASDLGFGAGAKKGAAAEFRIREQFAHHIEDAERLPAVLAGYLVSQPGGIFTTAREFGAVVMVLAALALMGSLTGRLRERRRME